MESMRAKLIVGAEVLELMLDFHNFIRRIPLQITYVFRVKSIPLIYGWSEVKTIEKVKVVFVEILRLGQTW